eukprot:6475234-Lingulodinium_polyedra.AAC.1
MRLGGGRYVAPGQRAGCVRRELLLRNRWQPGWWSAETAELRTGAQARASARVAHEGRPGPSPARDEPAPN